MSKIKKYEVVFEDNLTSLQNSMFNKIESGWQPFGGISITSINMEIMDKGRLTEVKGMRYAQAIVLYSKE
jgi:hypothetical protein